MSALGAGSTLCNGRYELETVLGRGGMAIVWRALDLQLERPVAIKVISDVLASDPKFVARFEREARIAAALNHPNLVKVFDFSIDAERPFLIMEYVAGGTLAEARARALDAESMARELLDAVAHIHAAGILHRDIKPANVLLATDGSPRLTDFGIARGDETTGLTQTGQVLGTLRYIAPEAARGEPATPQSDLYSLGVLLSELQGKPPALEALIARMTTEDPAARPATAAEALAELDPTRALGETRALGDTAPTTPLATTPRRAAAAPAPRIATHGGGFALDRRHAIAGALTLLAVLLVVVIAASGGGSPKPATTPRALPPGAPAAQQLDRLEQIVRSVPRRN